MRNLYRLTPQSLLFCVVAACCAVAAPAYAEGDATPPAQLEPAPANTPIPLTEAKAAQSKAAQLFRENKFVEAAELLQLAYRGDPRPILLFNSGQAYRKAEHAADAKRLYEQFLTAEPDHPLAAETRGYIKDMEALMAAQEHAKQVAFAMEEQLEEQKTRERQAALLLEKERLASLAAKQSLTQTQAQLERERNKPIYRRPWFWSLMTGVGVVIIAGTVTGAYFAARARTDKGTLVIDM